MIRVELGPATVAFTGRDEGDLGSLAERGPGGPSAACEARRRAVVERPWSWLRQVHGPRVVTVDAPGGGAGEEADALVSAADGTALAILTADCAPVAFASEDGVIAAAHAGWRGLADGVLEATVGRMRALGAGPIVAALGPCIHAECYEFSPADMEVVIARAGEAARSTTSKGTPALDVPAAVVAVLDSVGVPVDTSASACTACDDDRWFSHRARRDDARQAGVVWLP